MKAGVVHAREDIRFEDIEKPVPKAGQVLIKVKYTGICGSDVPRVNGDACHFYPNVLGHEFSGVIEEVGEGVTSLKIGDRVAGVPLVPCLGNNLPFVSPLFKMKKLCFLHFLFHIFVGTVNRRYIFYLYIRIMNTYTVFRFDIYGHDVPSFPKLTSHLFSAPDSCHRKESPIRLQEQ